MVQGARFMGARCHFYFELGVTIGIFVGCGGWYISLFDRRVVLALRIASSGKFGLLFDGK